LPATLSFLLLAAVLPTHALAQEDIGPQDTSAADSILRSTDEAKVSGLRAHALGSLQKGDPAAAIKAADAMVRISPDDPRTTRLAGDIYLRSGKPKWAVRMFDRYLETNADEMPDLWQRGIALYFMGDFKTGAEQFERHRTVNPNDVENAAWHFLCVSKLDSPDEAKKRVLAAPNDPRIPMEEIRHMLITGDRDAVTNRINETPANSPTRLAAQFYGNFYLGLYADALGETEKAKSLMKQAAKDAPRNYMGDIARVYADWLGEGDL
tara:strand:+ start:118515 stop:119312 length:798 start_codon:yes stop_codon:yes gene_type:complete